MGRIRHGNHMNMVFLCGPEDLPDIGRSRTDILQDFLKLPRQCHDINEHRHFILQVNASVVSTDNPCLFQLSDSLLRSYAGQANPVTQFLVTHSCIAFQKLSDLHVSFVHNLLHLSASTLNTISIKGRWSIIKSAGYES